MVLVGKTTTSFGVQKFGLLNSMLKGVKLMHNMKQQLPFLKGPIPQKRKYPRTVFAKVKAFLFSAAVGTSALL